MIDKDKTYQTRCGYQVVIYAVYPGQEWAVHGAYFKDGVWESEYWTISGNCMDDVGANSSYDLIEVAPAQTYWMNIYESGCGGVYSKREDADVSCGGGGRSGKAEQWKITIKGNTMTGEKVEA